MNTAEKIAKILRDENFTESDTDSFFAAMSGVLYLLSDHMRENSTGNHRDQEIVHRLAVNATDIDSFIEQFD